MNTVTNEVTPEPTVTTKVASLTHLSGQQRGQILQLKNQTYHLIADGDQFAILDVELGDQHCVLAHLHPAGESYEIEALEGKGIRLNGTRLLSALLSQGDVIEIENPAVLLKFGFVLSQREDKINLGTLFDDCVKRTRFEANSRGGFIARLPINILVDLTEKDSLKFRALVIVALAILVSLNFYQWYRSSNLEREVAEKRQALDGLTSWFKKQHQEYISRGELQQISDSFKSELSQADRRVSALETQSGASQRVISEVSRADIFLQGS